MTNLKFALVISPTNAWACAFIAIMLTFRKIAFDYRRITVQDKPQTQTFIFSNSPLEGKNRTLGCFQQSIVAKDTSWISLISYRLPYEKRWDSRSKEKLIQDSLYPLPEGWEWTRLCSISTSINYGVSNSAESEGQQKLLRITDIDKQKVDWRKVSYTTVDEEAFQKYKIEEEDILFARIGATVGKTYLATDVPTNSVYASYLIRVRTLFCRPRYLIRFLDSPFYWNQISSNSVGSGRPNVNGTLLGSLIVPIPPLAEQRRIVETLGKHLALIDEIEQAQADLDALFAQLKSKVLDLAIRGELTAQDPNDEPADKLLERIHTEKVAMVERGELKPKDIKSDTVIFTGSDGLRYEKLADGDGKVRCIEEEIPFEIPEGWAWSRLANTCLPQETAAPSGEQFNYIDIATIDNVTNRIKGKHTVLTAKAPSRASRKVHEGSVLFSTVRPYLRNIAQVSQSYEDSIASSGFYVITPVGGYLDSTWLFQTMLSDFVVNTINSHIKGDNSPSVRKENMDSQLIAIPPLREQQRISLKIREVLNKI